MVGCLLFCADVTDGAQQCSVLQVISGDIDGILHRHSLLLRAGLGCWFFSFFSFSQRALYCVHLLLRTHYYLDKKRLFLYIFVSSTLIY